MSGISARRLIRVWQGQEAAARRLAPTALVNTFGNGLFYTTSALYFTRIVGLSAIELGFGLTVAGACGVAASVPFGRVTDRWGARRVLPLLWAAQAIGLLAYTQIRSYALFLPLVCVVVVLDRGGATVWSALLGTVFPKETRVRGRAFLRACSNTGVGLGAAIGGGALQLDSRWGYQLMIVLDAATYIAAAIMVTRAAQPAAQAESAGQPERVSAKRAQVFRDRRYLIVTGLSAVLTLQFGLLEVGIPIWISRYTSAPRAAVSGVLIVNTALVAMLQMRASKGTESTRRAARACMRAGWLLAGACVVYAFAGGMSTWMALAMVLCGAIVQTYAEVFFSAGSMALCYDLADPQAPGTYQGVFQGGFAAALLVAPLIVSSTALRFGLPGWIGLGAIFLMAGSLMPIAVRVATASKVPEVAEQDEAPSNA